MTSLLAQQQTVEKDTTCLGTPYIWTNTRPVLYVLIHTRLLQNRHTIASGERNMARAVSDLSN